jgi:Zn finger protein HypA/HybF involved in hydrogenase expression
LESSASFEHEQALEMNVASFNRTLDQELAALLRGASLECLLCGEFVMHARDRGVFCPECGSQLGDEAVIESGLESTLQAG